MYISSLYHHTCEFHMLIDTPETPQNGGQLKLSYGIPIRYPLFPADIVRTFVGLPVGWHRPNGVGNRTCPQNLHSFRINHTPCTSDLQSEPPEASVPTQENQFQASTAADIRWVNWPMELGEHMNGITPMSHHPNSTQAGSQLASPPIHCIPARFFANSFAAVEGPMKGLHGVSSLPFQDSKSTWSELLIQLQSVQYQPQLIDLSHTSFAEHHGYRQIDWWAETNYWCIHWFLQGLHSERKEKSLEEFGASLVPKDIQCYPGCKGRKREQYQSY